MSQKDSTLNLPTIRLQQGWQKPTSITHQTNP